MAFDRTSLGYDFSSPSIASTSTTIFIPLANNVETENNDVKNEFTSENVDKGKSILGAPPKFDKANQNIGALRFENNFLAEKTKKLEAELFQVRA